MRVQYPRIVGDDEAKNLTRFAPSPNGWLIWSCLFRSVGARQVPAHEGEFLLRIEDIDTGRARAHFVDGIYQDLAWLGLTWPEPVLVQSTRFDYQVALGNLRDRIWFIHAGLRAPKLPEINAMPGGAETGRATLMAHPSIPAFIAT